MNKYIIYLIFILWTLIHIYFLQLNSLLKVPDSFAYLQMSYYLKTFSIQWFWTGWFGFLYSLPIAVFDYFINNDFLSAQIINIISFFISWILIYKIWKKYLYEKYNIILLILFFISSTFIHYNINILSENIYMPLFLGLFLLIDQLISQIKIKDNIVEANSEVFYIPLSNIKLLLKSLFIWLLLALLYYTRGEAFIYLLSIILIFTIFFLKKDLTFKSYIKIISTITISFFLFISPYIYLLYNITWEIWLTNKWSSNIRQAIMRWIEKKDDIWFEKAVWELTEDKKHLIAGFAWWLKYDKPQNNIWIIEYLTNNQNKVFEKFLLNQKQLYFKTLPKLILWEVLWIYYNKHFIFYNNKVFFWIMLIPLFLLIFWTYKLITNKGAKKDLIIILWGFYFTASIFFTLFFVIDRYFLIFIPILLIIIVYWVQKLFHINEQDYLSARNFLTSNFFDVSKYLLLSSILIFLYALWSINYYTYHKYDDSRYDMKKEMGLWLKQEICKQDICKYKIMERFPIVTYYSWTKERWLTPYVDNLNDLLIYAKYNNIDYLIVDTMDFRKYRPRLDFLLDEKEEFEWLKNIKTFKLPGKEVIIYEILKH